MRVGIALRDSAISLVALKGRRVIHAFTVEGQEQPAAVLKAELQSRRIRRHVRAGISRSLALVKALRLPQAADRNLTQMVAFELERHVPFPAEEVCFDFASLPRVKGSPAELLVVAAERRTVDGALRLLEEASLRPLSLTVAAHDLIALVGRRPRQERVAWLHRASEDVTLVFLEGPRLRLSRSLPWVGDESLAEELRKSLALLRWSDLEEVWVSGDGSQAPDAAVLLGDFAPVNPPPFSPAVSRAIAGLGEAATGLTLLALGVAWGPRRRPLNLLPESLRPRHLTPWQIATAASVVLTVGLGLSVISAREYQDRRYLAGLNQVIRGLDPEVRTVEQLSAELGRKRQLLETARALEDGTLKPLALLRELTELVPADAWLTSLTVDAKGIELTGQAAAANQLIPLLENSPRLEKVEFASPVTKMRDKEQFRIRATWETSAKPVPAPPPQERPRRATPR